MALEQNIVIRRGATFLLDIALEAQDGTPLVPSGGLVGYHIAARAGAEPSFVQTSLDGDIAVTGALATIELDAEETKALAAGMHYHELYFVDLDGARAILFYGTCEVIDSQLAQVGSLSL